MGPPLKAAENMSRVDKRAPHEHRFNGAAAKSSGKYRHVLERLAAGNASMGPSLKAAENNTMNWTDPVECLASMGPPLKAAENSRRKSRSTRCRQCFNGAAAKSSGKCRSTFAHVLEHVAASMGPPLKAAENTRREKRNASTSYASMGPSLKAAENRQRPRPRDRRARSFNGAAAKSSGK